MYAKSVKIYQGLRALAASAHLEWSGTPSHLLKTAVQCLPERLVTWVIPWVEAHFIWGIGKANLSIWISIGKSSSGTRDAKGLDATAEVEGE